MLSKEHLHYIELFIKNINENIHFSYGHFNDGEMSIIMGSNDPISRGDQKSSSELRKKLITSLIFEKENFESRFSFLLKIWNKGDFIYSPNVWEIFVQWNQVFHGNINCSPSKNIHANQNIIKVIQNISE